MQVWHGWLRSLTVVIVAGIIGGALVFCDEEPIELDRLPQSVIDALKTRFAKAELVDAQKKEYVGRTVYVIDLKLKRQKVTATVAENGGIVEVVKEIAADDLPEIVRRTIIAKHPGAKIALAQEVTEIKYTVAIQTETGEKVEFSVDPAGMIQENDDD